MQEVFDPKAVVLIGVSRQTGVGAYNGLEMLQRFGYRGAVYVVHPHAGEILGQKVYQRLADIPEVPDLAVIAVGRDRVLPVAEECFAKGIRWLIIITQGFADADREGKRLQEALVTAARHCQARIIGPNTMGVMNAFNGFTTAFVDLPRSPDPAPVSLVAQSGALQVGSESFLGPLGKAVDIGNAADLGFVEVLEYLEQDPQTRIIALHIEGLIQGRRFLETADRINRSKPVVIFKTGVSASGAQAALSHTGSMVGEDQIFSAAVARAGLTRVHSALDLQDTLQAFRKLPLLRGRRIGIATPSGALGIIALDALSREDLVSGPLPENIRNIVQPQGPYWHILHNPVDLWPIGMLTGDYLKIAQQTLSGFLADPNIDGIICMLPALSSPLHSNIIASPAFFADLHLERFNKPLVVSLYGDGREVVRRNLDPVPGVAGYFSVEQAAHALGQLYRRYQALKRPTESWRLVAKTNPPAPTEPLLLGQAALEFLAAYQIPVVSGRLTHTPEEAAAAAASSGYPVVLKIIAPEWLHKSDRGGVILNLMTEEAVRAGFERLQYLSALPFSGPVGILVQKQLSGRELLLGIKADSTFGPVIVAGYGGVHTELWGDVVKTLAPVNLAQAREMLASLRSYPLLTGYRGAPPTAIDELAQTLVHLSNLAVAHPTLRELDINPLMATPEGCWAVDARLVWRQN